VTGVPTGRYGGVFGISGFELLIIALFILLIFGPDKLPEIARTVSRFTREFRAARDAMEGMIRAEMYTADRNERLKNAPDWTKAGERTKEWSDAKGAAAAGAASSDAASDTPPAEDGATAVEEPAAAGAEPEPEEAAPVAVPLDAEGNPIAPVAEEDSGFGDEPVWGSGIEEPPASDGEEVRA